MSDQITTAMVDTYNTGIEMLVQETDSLLSSRVRMEADSGEKASFDQIGPVAARKRTVRHQDTQYINSPHKRRWVINEDWDVADLLDTTDLIRILNDPGGAYADNFIAAFHREKDANIIAAALGTAYTGKAGTTGVALPAPQQIAAGGTGFTLTKLRSAMKQLKAKNAVRQGKIVDTGLTVAWTNYQEDEFMDTAEVKSHDYNTQRVLVSGGMGDDTFFGFTYVRLEDWEDEDAATHRILPYAGTTRSCVAWVKRGLLHNAPKMPSVKVDQLPTKKYSWQFFCDATFGSTRMQEELVMQIDCTET